MKLTSYLLVTAFILVAGGCSKSDDDSSSSSNGGGGGSTTITIDSQWQYSINVDGTTYAKTENGTSVQGVFSNSGSIVAMPDTSINNYGSVLYNPTTTISYIEVTRNGHHYVGGTADDPLFLQYFAQGSYQYTAENINGFSVRWFDDSGTMWGTDLGSGNQAGSAIAIDAVKDVTTFGDYTLKVLIHFNCKLYDGGGNSKTLTDGKYVGEFSNFH